MEVHELKEWMAERFTLLERGLEYKFKAVDECILKLDARVDAHEHWITKIKGMWAALGAVLGLIIFKWEIWNRFWGK